MVSTLASHAGNEGSNPSGGTKFKLAKASFFILIIQKRKAYSPFFVFSILSLFKRIYTSSSCCCVTVVGAPISGS